MSDKNIAKKEKAIEIMKKMGIYKPYIKGFRESDKVCFFEGFGGFWIDQEPELHKKMKAIEEKHKCKVYAVTHEYTEFGELYDFLIVPPVKLPLSLVSFIPRFTFCDSSAL